MGKRDDIPNGYKVPYYWDKKFTKTGRRLYVGPRKEHCFSVTEVFDAEIKGKNTYGDAYVPEDKKIDGIDEEKDYKMPPDFKMPDGWKVERVKGRKAVYTSPQGFKCFSLFQVYVSTKKAADMAKGKGALVGGEVVNDSFDNFGELLQKIFEIEEGSKKLMLVYNEHKRWQEENWAEISSLTDEARGLELELTKLQTSPGGFFAIEVQVPLNLSLAYIGWYYAQNVVELTVAYPVY